MKTKSYFWIAALVMLFQVSTAQVSVSVNIGTAPAWGPSVTTERYYYMPDIETYYDIHSREYIYLNNGYWVRHRTLPVVYRDYDLRRGRTVIIHDYRGRAPYVHYTTHKVKYVKGPKYHKHQKHWKHKNKGHRHHRDRDDD